MPVRKADRSKKKKKKRKKKKKKKKQPLKNEATLTIAVSLLNLFETRIPL